MAIVEISSGIAIQEFELQISEDNTEFYLTVCAFGEFYDKIFKSASELREWLKNEWNFREEQIHELWNKAVKNDGSTVLNEEKENCIDIDEQMHEYEDREAEFAEVYAEWAESFI